MPVAYSFELDFVLEELDNIWSFGHNGNLMGTIVPLAVGDRPPQGLIEEQDNILKYFLDPRRAMKRRRIRLIS